MNRRISLCFIRNQLQRLSDMTLVIEPTKTSAGTRKIPVTEDVAKCFQAIIEDREKPKVEKVVDGYTIYRVSVFG